ncbi:MAG: hypothetical protein AB1744_08755 [Candidatus Zixiibacteriota bacterium]
MTDSIKFTMNDAWVLYAIPPTEDGAELPEIIARADYVNHAIPTAKEIRRALRKANEASLVCFVGSKVKFLSKHRAWVRAVTSKPKFAMDAWKALHQALNERRWVKEKESGYELSDDEHKDAYQSYLKMLKKRN